MSEREECILILRENMARIQSEFGVTGLSVFGSVARGDYRADSDVDILVAMPPKIFQMSGLKAFLESILSKPVDLVRKHPHLSAAFVKQISRDAITLI